MGLTEAFLKAGAESPYRWKESLQVTGWDTNNDPSHQLWGISAVKTCSLGAMSLQVIELISGLLDLDKFGSVMSKFVSRFEWVMSNSRGIQLSGSLWVRAGSLSPVNLWYMYLMVWCPQTPVLGVAPSINAGDGVALFLGIVCLISLWAWFFNIGLIWSYVYVFPTYRW
jgi:hypothetical protein